MDRRWTLFLVFGLGSGPDTFWSLEFALESGQQVATWKEAFRQLSRQHLLPRWNIYMIR